MRAWITLIKLVKLVFLSFFLLSGFCNALTLAGVSKEKITPIDFQRSPRLAGYKISASLLGCSISQNPRKPSENLKHTDLYVRTLVIKHDNKTIALVSVDVIGLFRNSLEFVHLAFPDVFCIISATHTHSAPDTLGVWSTEYVGEYLAFVQSAIIRSIHGAIQQLKPVTFSVGTTKIIGLSQDYRLPFVIDNNMNVLFVNELETGKMLSVLVNWSAHPANFGKGSINLSGDYPAVLINLIDQKFGCISLFFNGAIGGHITTSWAKLVKKPSKEGFSGFPAENYIPETGEQFLPLNFEFEGKVAPRNANSNVLDDKKGIERIEILALNLFEFVKSVYADRETVDVDYIIAKRKIFEIPIENRFYALNQWLYIGNKLEKSIILKNYSGIFFFSYLLVFLSFFTIIVLVIKRKKSKTKYSCKTYLFTIFVILFLNIGIYGLIYYLSRYMYVTNTEVNYVQLGDKIGIVFVPGELYPELSIGTSIVPDVGCDYHNLSWEPPIKPLMKPKYKFVIGLANDEIGYIIPKCLWDEKKPYAYHREGMSSPQYNEANSAGYDTAGIVISNLIGLLKE